MRAEPWWEASEWAMRHYSDSPCAWIVRHSVLKMGSRQLSFGQNGSFISRNRSLKKQTSNLRSFDNRTKFMLIGLWAKVMMHHLIQDIQAKLKNLSIKYHEVLGAPEVPLLWQEVISWIRPDALFILFQKPNIVYSYQIWICISTAYCISKCYSYHLATNTHLSLKLSDQV